HPKERLSYLNQYPEQVRDRDDLFIEYIGLHTLLGQFEEAGRLLKSRNFHPWEGGEGKTPQQHIVIHVELAKQALDNEQLDLAKQLLEQATIYPPNLGEGKLYG